MQGMIYSISISQQDEAKRPQEFLKNILKKENPHLPIAGLPTKSNSIPKNQEAAFQLAAFY
jgi:hypothetical protein